MYARYAIYFCPGDQSPLSRYGRQVLGRNAQKTERKPGSSSGFSDSSRWEELTRKPAHYGFHATLKAPFEIAATKQPEALEQACRDLASEHSAIPLTGLAPRLLNGFAALTLEADPLLLQELARCCVEKLELWRAPLSQYDIDRRRNSNLSARQLQQLTQFGYPYIFDDFKFHMTLSSQLTDQDQDYVNWLSTQYKQLVLSDPVLDRIALFAQSTRDSPFFRINEFCFA
ncbi:MAG: DUF1045 domain-containing protein [Granulosicoccus sp.]